MDEQKKYEVIKKLVDSQGNKDRAFLDPYIDEFNAKFALPSDHIKSVFETQPSEETINLTLAVLTQRTVDTEPRKRYIPPMNHPWRSKVFWKFVKSQEHHLMDDIPV